MSITSISSRFPPVYGPLSGSQPQGPKLAAPAVESASRSSGSVSTRVSTGTALYALVSGMGNSDPATTALLSSWNDIMQTPNSAPMAESTSFHLTA
jgi:hypothetical protein